MIQQRKKWLLAALAWLAMSVYALIFRPSVHSGAPPFAHFDKFAHALLFLVQTWLAAKYWLSVNRKPPYMLLFIGALCWAIVSELAQHFLTTTRQGDVWDAAADMLGVCLALQFAHWRAQVTRAA